jgi:hypothetical protein
MCPQKVFYIISICALVVRGSNSLKLDSCSEASDKITLCKTGLMYLNNVPPEPFPAILDTWVIITDIVDVNTESNTMTIFADIVLAWNDSGISLHGSNDSRYRFHIVLILRVWF